MDQIASKTGAYLKKLAAAGTGLENCPVRVVLAPLGSKWSPLVLQLLSERPYRFSELRRLVPDISIWSATAMYSARCFRPSRRA